MRKNKKLRVWFSAILAVLLAFAMVLPLVYQVFAAPTDAETKLLADIATRQEELQAAIRAAEAEKKDKVAQKQAYDQVLYLLNDQVSAIETETEKLDEEINSLEEQIIQQNDELEERTELFRSRAAALYEEGSISYLDILLDANSFSDFLQRMEITSVMFEYDKTRMEKIKEIRAQLEKDKERVITAKEEQLAKKAELDVKKEEQNTQLRAVNKVLSEINKNIETMEAMEVQLDAEQKRIQELIRSRERKQNDDGTLGSYSGGSMVWPTPSTRYITSVYGWRTHPVLGNRRFHNGIDIGAGQGASILAANGGTVIYSGVNGGYGNCLIIDHGGGIKTLYGHCSKLLVANGEKVSAGQLVAYVGSTGLSTGPHLHFEVYVNGSTVDPMSYY